MSTFGRLVFFYRLMRAFGNGRAEAAAKAVALICRLSPYVYPRAVRAARPPVRTRA